MQWLGSVSESQNVVVSRAIVSRQPLDGATWGIHEDEAKLLQDSSLLWFVARKAANRQGWLTRLTTGSWTNLGGSESAEAYLADCDKEKERSGIGWPVAMIFLILKKNDGRAKVRRVRFASQIES